MTFQTLKSLIISPEIELKLLEKHGVRRVDVEACFHNCTGEWFEDTRVNHKTQPPTLWFIARTHKCEWLKVVFVFKDKCLYLKTAYRPNKTELTLYERLSKGK